MRTNDMFRNALDILLQDSVFRILGINYNGKEFGNTCVILCSDYQVDVYFVEEKGVCWCEIRKAGERFFLEDILTLLDITEVDSSREFIEFIEKTSNLIKSNFDRIINLFDENSFLKTKTVIKEIATKRAKEMLGLN